MTQIEEAKAVKLPTKTSLFVHLGFYQKTIYETLCQEQDSYHHKQYEVFEFPINRLYFLINLLTRFDEVSFTPLQEEEKEIITANRYKFKKKLYKHQLEAINFGINHKGWMLLDDCGLGKTASMICLAEFLRKKQKLKHCLIICGVNGLKYNWAEEIQKFSNLSYTILGSRRTKTGKLKIGTVAERIKALKNGFSEFFCITNIETLQNKDFVEAFKKSKSNIGMIVFDEAHHCKNPQSKSAKTLLKVQSERNIALTGTVIMNNPENAYVPLKWTGNTDSTYGKFKSMFSVYGGFGGVQVIGYKNLDLLQELIQDCSLRRRKEEVLDLPDRNYLTDYVELSSAQRKLYDEVQQHILTELDLLDHKPTVLEEITINMRLRQITAYPGMLSTEVTTSSKLDRMEELVEEIVAQGDKVVVFNTFKGAAEECFKRLQQYNPVICTGDSTEQEIDIAKNIFTTDESCKVMVATWQKMGTGYTFTSANYVIFIDTPYTRADFDQSADRIYRIGQNKKCFIITLVCKDTYDERVLELVDMKEQLSGYIVDNKQVRTLNILD